MTYDDISEEGFIDQQVSFENPAGTPIVPEARYLALDADGEAVPGIEVETAFGSDRGLLVVPPGGSSDVLTFEGERVADVVGVAADLVDVRVVEGYDLPLGEVEITPLDARGLPVTKFDPFTQVSLVNPTDSEIGFRVVCLVYDSPPPGEAQQATEISVVVEQLTVPGGVQETTPVATEFAARTAELGYGCDSLKAHPTPISPRH